MAVEQNMTLLSLSKPISGANFQKSLHSSSPMTQIIVSAPKHEKCFSNNNVRCSVIMV